MKVLVIGAGLAGSEAAYYLANHGISVFLAEMKAKKPNPAQKLSSFAELVCTNSLKSVRPETAHGLLKYEMQKLNSLVLAAAWDSRVPAGDALAVDRVLFSEQITEKLTNHYLITIIDEEITDPLAAMKKLQCDCVVVATGPLTSANLEIWLKEFAAIGNGKSEDWYFYDAIAPVVDLDSLNLKVLYAKDRYKSETESADYLNAPMNKEQYEAFVGELVKAEKVPVQKFEEYKFFESCLPIDVTAERGIDTLRFSCMKPVGLEHNQQRPYAVVQLRKENLLGDALNLVGFQNRLTHKEQVRIFKMIPGFENATFNKLGSVHRNSFINAKKLLNFDLSSKEYPCLYFAGQIVGVEGYTESASMGLYVGFQILRKLKGLQSLPWPKETGIGALINYVQTIKKPCPSNINMGLLPSVTLSKEQRKNKERKRIKKQLIAECAQKSLDNFLLSL